MTVEALNAGPEISNFHLETNKPDFIIENHGEILDSKSLHKPEENGRRLITWRLVSYMASSLLHLIAAANKAFKLDIFNSQRTIDLLALNLSKISHTFSYGALAIEAFRDNRMLDAIAKILDPLMSNFSSIENINLTKGISGGLNVIDYAQTHFVKKNRGKINNLKDNYDTAVTMLKDIFSKKRNLFVHPRQEKGHTLALSGYGIIGASLLGLTIGPLNKSMNFIRNLMGVIGNTITIYHPDNQKKVSGSLFNIYAAFDSLQKFLPENIAEVVNNINMAIYNLGIYLYGDLSNKRTHSEFDHYPT